MTAPTGQMTSYEALAARTQSALAKRLLSIIVAKKTNLCVSVDVTSPQELLSIIRKVGKYVCMVKVGSPGLFKVLTRPDSHRYSV
jgi:Orotidine 5'-phosphate decarboxylase / HUMPS family